MASSLATESQVAAWPGNTKKSWISPKLPPGTPVGEPIWSPCSAGEIGSFPFEFNVFSWKSLPRDGRGLAYRRGGQC